MADSTSSNLYGLVDMGSNGIRFSITDLAQATARSLPTVFQERLGISLYDAQYASGEKAPIPQDIIHEVISSLKRFKAVCADFGVPESNIRVLATEATRTALNSEDYRRQIQDATGWEVNMLRKEEEGKIGAYGVASSFESVDGLVMDLGGGSTQLTWMIFANGGDVQTSHRGSFSFPYGAAALTRQLAVIEKSPHSKTARKDLASKMRTEFQDAFEQLELPESLRWKAQRRGLTLYLSGGGFRGWGYILMSQSRIQPYPVPIINGFSVSVKEFGDVDEMKALVETDINIFRVSKRRASQVPAVAFLIKNLLDALPFVSDVRFCQGGIREGFLFDSLSPEIRSTSPLAASTSRYATCPTVSQHIASLLQSSLPGENDLDRTLPQAFTFSFLKALANTMYVQATSVKESASTAALYLPITGILSSAHGVSHADRALLSIALSQRWGGELPPPNENLLLRLQDLVSKQEAWWANYLGAIAGLIGLVYPAGRLPPSHSSSSPPRISIFAEWACGLGKKANQQGVVLNVKLLENGGVVGRDTIKDAVEHIEDLGKKKNRIGGRDYGFGLPVRCDIDWV